MRTLSLTITADLAGRKVKSLLRRQLRLSESHIARVKLRDNGICLNGVRCRTVDIAKEGDVLTVEVGDAPAQFPNAADIPLKVVYEDADCAIIDKAAGMACHGSTEKGDATLAAALYHRWGGESAFHPVSRLDKGTSGLLCIARSGYAHTLFRQNLHTDNYIREYLLVCSPPPAQSEGIIDLPIEKVEGSIKRRISPSGAPAKTEYRVLQAENGRALVWARLHTGRTHQIRLHFAAIGCPLVGDWLYGEASGEISRPALHSACLSMVQPISGEKLEFHSPLPEDIAVLVPGFGEASECFQGKHIALL
ncbi:MAG: RluA family pseudouridine synthase [Oscillospiraceae bacterium]|nr:RluA family pseudouridine synthase [Oscillospiraceae bacterium]